MNRPPYWMRAGILALAALLLTACGGNSGSGGDGGDSTLVVAVPADADTLDWTMHVESAAEIALWGINEALVKTDTNGEMVPALAASLPEPVPGDPERWRVTLKEGITFTNGEPFNAEAVKANVDRVAADDFDTPADGFESYAGAEVVDDYVVDILTDGPDSALLYKMESLRMLPPKAMNDPDYAENPVGTGPYLFKKWDRGREIVLERNPDYWGEAGTVETVEIRFIEDENTRVAALSTGEIDMTQIAADQADQVPQVLRPKQVAESGAIRININRPPYNDVRFRQALNYAIDKDALNETIFGGQSEVSACQSVPSTVFGFNPDLKAYPYDPDKARELLAQVDLPKNFAVQFEGVSGFWVRDREVQEAIASYWRDVGLDVDLTINTTDVYLDKLLERDLKVAPGIIYQELDHQYSHAARIADRIFNRTGAISTIGDQYPEADALMKKAASFDESESETAFHQLFELSCDQALQVFTLDRFDLTGAAKGLSYEPNRNFMRIDFDRVRMG